MRSNNLLEKLNTKMIFSRFTDSLVYFVEDLDTIIEDDFKKLGYYAVFLIQDYIQYTDNYIGLIKS
jgi:hypothetical protein